VCSAESGYDLVVVDALLSVRRAVSEVGALVSFTRILCVPVYDVVLHVLKVQPFDGNALIVFRI
jgi:hypothetical protein